MTISRLARPRFVFVLLGLIILLGMLTWLSPADVQLGQVVKIVYLHVAFTRAGIIFSQCAGLLALILLVRSIPRLDPWLRSFFTVGLGLYVIGFIISVFSQMTAWGGIAWLEPRVIAATQVMVTWAMALVVFSLWNNRYARLAIVAIFAAYLTWASITTPNVLHPGNAIGTSSSLAIQIYPVLMLLVAVIIGVWTAWSIRPSDLLPFLLVLPTGYADHPDRSWPVLIFLNGSGERGADVELLKKTGLPRLISQPGGFPAVADRFIFFAPQCPANLRWRDVLPWLEHTYQHAVADLHIETRRIYLTGISMGGFGLWEWASRYPDRFAALVPIAGSGQFMEMGISPEEARRLVNIPIWIFHGADDNTVPVSTSEQTAQMLRDAGGNPRLTVYPGVGHDSWTQTYQNPELYDWVLENQKPSPQ